MTTDPALPADGAQPVEDHRPRPRGVAPRYLHALIIGGITLFVGLVVFVAARPPREGLRPVASPTPAADIDGRLETQREIERQGQAARPPQEAPRSPLPRQAPMASAQLPPAGGAPGRPRARGSSVALSYRGQERARQAAADPGTPVAEAPLVQQLAFLKALEAVQGSPQSPTSEAVPAPPVSSTAPGRRRDSSRLNRAHGPQHVVFEGSLIDTVLLNRLAGDFSGPVICMVSQPVLSRDGQRVLVPAGSRALGQAQRVAVTGQTRLAVAFHRLVMPDGYSVDLDQFAGLDAAGETALKDQVNNHYWRTFGASLAIGALGGLANLGAAGTGTWDAYRAGVGASAAQSATQILDRFLNNLPTITIREGHRVKIYLTQDLLLPAYDDHRMPTDL